MAMNARNALRLLSWHNKMNNIFDVEAKPKFIFLLLWWHLSSLLLWSLWLCPFVAKLHFRRLKQSRLYVIIEFLTWHILRNHLAIYSHTERDLTRPIKPNEINTKKLNRMCRIRFSLYWVQNITQCAVKSVSREEL